MPKDTQSRKWQITINNPLDYGFTHERIKKELDHLKSTLYYCMADELGSTHHTHIYVVFSSAVRFSTIKNCFNEAHLEIAHGTSEQNRDYIMKAGKWSNDKKHGTTIPGTFEEHGEMPVERKGTRNDLADLYDMIKSGSTNFEIMEQIPEHLLHIDKIDRARLVIKAEEYKTKFRKLEVNYIWGPTGVGKTKYVMEKHGYSTVYRVTDYEHPFDQYESQDVLLFDEFRSQLKISDMLNYLDGYPLQLPCRYTNRQACYTKVYILSNMMLEQQYTNIRMEQASTWMAFKRRIHKVQYFQGEHDFLPPATASDLKKLMKREG
ncbi:hypothetical protein [Alicyclobacillus sp. SP_1]|uniref:hypothetical protein n=1 Tax=Alicyclobacillus sp. SP_1 TaxID=2942475 RepID=UPI0021570BEE|nr:hypothetical protein [Alicyclobacillus sp. SP_1]